MIPADYIIFFRGVGSTTNQIIIPVQAVHLQGKNPMNHQKVPLNHHYHKTPLNHHESLHSSHVFVMKKKHPKVPEAEEGPDRRFPFGPSLRSWENHPFLMGFPSFPPFPPFPVVPRRFARWEPRGSQVLPQRQLLPTPPGERGPPAVSRRRGEIAR